MSVSLVIPGRNAAHTIRPCLEAVIPLLGRDGLEEIIFVDDGSTDDTAEIASEYPVTCLRSPPRGRSAARNLGWRTAGGGLVWFIDADCVADPDALAKLLPHFDDLNVGGVGGSFRMAGTGPLLTCLIHQEIIERHRAIPDRINFVATGNAAYRRRVLQQVGGFDERFARAQDAELSYRVREAGFALAFASGSQVEHSHDTQLWTYLRTQAQQGYWRFWLHLRHKAPATGDSYSSIVDNVQPPLAMLLLASLPLLLVPRAWPVTPVLAVLLGATQVPMTVRIVKRTRRLAHLCYAAMSFLRAFARGLGLTQAALSYLMGRKPKAIDE